MEKFKQLLEKKRKDGAGLDPMQASARGSVLSDLMGSLDSEGAKKVKGIKKVTVAAKNPEDLESGLDTAKEILAQGEKQKPSGNPEEGEMKDDSQEEEYDDQDAEGPNHMPTEKEATSFGSQPAEDGSPEVDEPAEGSPEHVAQLKAQLEDAKAHIAHLQKPKAFY